MVIGGLRYLLPRLLRGKSKQTVTVSPLPETPANYANQTTEIVVEGGLMKEIILSTVRNIARAIIATLLAVMPQIVEAFRAGAVDQDLFTKAAFGLVISGLAGLVVLLQRLYEKFSGKPAA